MTISSFQPPTQAADLLQLQADGDFLRWTLARPEQADAVSWTLANGTTVAIWDTGVICFTPTQYGELDLVLSSGIHGNETAPIEICAALVRDILTGQITLKERVLFLFGNPPAINAAKRELVHNMNRFFSGFHQISDLQQHTTPDNFEKVRCARLEHYVSRFYQALPSGRQRCLYDLHTAIRGSQFEKFAVYPFLHGKPWSAHQFSLLAACDIHTFLLMQSPASTFSYYAAQQHGADAFTLELGKVRPMGQNDMSRFTAIVRTLGALICGDELTLKPFNEQDFQLFTVYRSINKQTDAFALCFANTVENFTQLPLGTLLATDHNVEYRVEQPGEAIIFPNPNVAIGQRAMLMVKPVSIAGQVV